MKIIKSVNKTLVNEQVERYDRTGHWPTRQIGRLPEPVMLAHRDGTYVPVTSGTVKGLLMRNESRYVDIQSGYVIAFAINKEQQAMVEELLFRELRSLVGVPYCVKWGDQPYIYTSPSIQFKE
jgi:hypothetical protein